MTDEEQNEEVEVDVTEISLSEDEINEWIEKLEELKETKNPVTLELDDENEVEVYYQENETEENSEEGE